MEVVRGLDEGDKWGETPLFVACEKGHIDAARWLLSKLGSTNMETANDDGVTPLSMACERGRIDVVKMLVEEFGANVEGTESGRPLIEATIRGSIGMVSFLLAYGASVDAVDRRGHTALWWSANRGHADVVRVLLAAGADRSIADIEGETPLDVARTEEIKVLLR